MAFCCTVLGSSIKLRILAQHVYAAAKLVFGIPDFRYYALANGLSELLIRFPRSKQRRQPLPASAQLSLMAP